MSSLNFRAVSPHCYNLCTPPGMVKTHGPVSPYTNCPLETCCSSIFVTGPRAHNPTPPPLKHSLAFSRDRGSVLQPHIHKLEERGSAGSDETSSLLRANQKSPRQASLSCRMSVEASFHLKPFKVRQDKCGLRLFTWGPEVPLDTPSSSGTPPLSGAPPHHSSSANISTCGQKRE